MKRINTSDDVTGSLGELTGLVRRIVAALDDSSTEPDERHVVCRRLSRTVFVEPEEPVLDWSAPMPSWGTQDFTVPPPAPAHEVTERLRKVKAKVEKSAGQVSAMTLPLPTAVDHANADLLAQELAGRKGK